jgi:hypothetical protein
VQYQPPRSGGGVDVLVQRPQADPARLKAVHGAVSVKVVAA